MTMPWDNQDNNWNNSEENQDNNQDNNWDSNEEHGDKDLEDIFGDSHSESDDSQDYQTHEEENNTIEDNDDSTHNEENNVEKETTSLDDVEEELASVPTKRSQATPQFSERDVYQIVNLTTILGVLNENQESWVDSIFGGHSSNDHIKRAIRIVSMDSTEIEDKIKPVEALQSLYEVSQENDPSKIIDNLLSSIKTVDDLSTADKGNLVSLMRKMSKNHADDNDGKVVPVRVSRNSSSAEIVDAMKKLMEENPAVSESLDSLSQCIDVIKTALK